MLQPPRQQEACYNDDEHSGPRSRPRGSLPIDQYTECYKSEIFPVQYFETSSALEGPANLCLHSEPPQINSKPFIPSPRVHNFCHNLSTPFQSSFDGSENYTSNRRRRNRDRRRLERELCCLRQREDQSKEDKGRRLERLQCQLEQYQSAKVDPPANIAERQTSTNYAPHVLLLLLLLLCKPTPVNAQGKSGKSKQPTRPKRRGADKSATRANAWRSAQARCSAIRRLNSKLNSP